MSAPVLIYIRDLIFSSKVVATARAQNIAFKVVRDVSKLMETPAERLLVDFNADGALDSAVAWKQKHAGHVTGFCAHVAIATIQRAKTAGIDRVMTNGAFSAQLEQIFADTSVPSAKDVEG